MAFHRKKLRKTTSVYQIIDVLHATLKVLEFKKIFISKKQAETTGEVPTSQFVIQILRGEEKTIQDKNVPLVNEMVQHFSLPPKEGDDFFQQVYQLFSTGMVSENKIGFIVALPNMYEGLKNRAIKLIKLAEKYSTSNYIGEIGKRDTFMVKVVSCHEFWKRNDVSGENEKHFLYRISDRIGNCGLFFSIYPPHGTPGVTETAAFKLWDCFEMTATPKKQEPNKDTGIKETVFSNITVTEMIGQGTEE